jgi:CubicO group peptidase (beta-lactamase class C family)
MRRAFFVLTSSICSALAHQAVLNHAVDGQSIFPSQKRAITPEISQFVDKLMKEGAIPGLSIGVVYANNTVDLQSWGIKTEDGDKLSIDVKL